MLTKPQNYEQTAAIEGGGETLQPGGYICKILRVQERMSRGGNPMFVFEFDIAQGNRAGFFKRKYENSTKMNANAKWGGSLYQSVSSEYGVGRLKGMITAIEHSNPGFRFNWDDPVKKNIRMIKAKRKKPPNPSGCAPLTRFAKASKCQSQGC